jgi:hypothetical protein
MTMRWLDQLALGARFSVAGRDGWIRVAMTTVGVGLGVALLLAAASLPATLEARDVRNAERNDFHLLDEPERGENTLLISAFDTTFGDTPIRGRVIQPDGAKPPVPPGIATLPGPGEIVVSPALAELLAAPDAALLRERLNHRVVGTIGDRGLAGPNEHAFYLGSDRLTHQADVRRIDHFGNDSRSEPMDPVLVLLVVVIFVVLLLPIAVFIAEAMRFGGAHRDRRLAAARLVGADGQMTRRIAIGESLVGAVLGVAAGAAFFLVGRQVVEQITLMGLSVFAADLRPHPVLAALVAFAVPATAVGVTLLGLRKVVIEPLGVVRKAGVSKRRLWWRLLLPAVGLALLYPLFGEVSRTGERANQYQVACGAALLLTGITSLLPWLVEAVVRRIGGSAVPWQLAIRRLQLDGGTAARVVSGIAVAAGGAIALQMLFADLQGGYTGTTGVDLTRAQVSATLFPGAGGANAADITAKLRDTPGVSSVVSLTTVDAVRARSTGSPQPPESETPASSVTVGDCAALREVAQIDRCAAGDVFVVKDANNPGRTPLPGERVELAGPDWTVPASARIVPPRRDPTGTTTTGVFATPTAISTAALKSARITAFMTTAPGGEAIEHIRNTAAAIDPLMSVSQLETTRVDNKFANVRRGLFAGSVATLLLIGSSMLVTALEQLRERQRLLAALVAFGTRRSTLSWSVLWQSAVPMLIGLALAIVAGTGLGAMLLTVVGRPIRFDWLSVAGISGAAAVVVLLVTALSLPALWKLIRPEGLRTE